MQKSESLRKNINFSLIIYILFFAAAVFKLFIVSGEEILALYAPHDELWYVLAASRWFWLSPNYDLMTLIHLPVYAIFIALVHLTGIPLRIGIELTFILSGFYFVYALRRIGVSQIICLLAFILIIFQPLSFDLFDRTLSETFYAPLLLASLASLIFLWISHGKKKLFFSFLTGLLFALLWFTREESLLIAGILAVVAFLIGFICYKETKNWRKVFSELKKSLFIPVIIIIAFSIFIHTANYEKYGLYAASELDGAGYKEAYTALLKIKPQKTVQFVPLTSDTRQMAYSVSPSFKELEPYLEDHSNFAFFWTKKTMGIDNEMAAGWFYWMLREAVDSAGYKTAPAENDFYKRVAKEINTAISEKKVPSRFIAFSFLDPNTFLYLHNFPKSFERVGGLFFSTQEPPEIQNNLFFGPNKETVDSMTNRRAHDIEPGEVTLDGWVFLNGRNIQKVSLQNESGETIASTTFFIPRTDVQEAYKKNNLSDIPENTGFHLEINQPEGALANAVLVFSGDNNEHFQVPYSKLEAQKPTQIETGNSIQSAYFAIDRKIVPGVSQNLLLKNKIQKLIWSIYGKIILFLSYLGILALAIIIYLRKKIDYKKPVYAVLVILFFVVIIRVLLFTLLDLDSWDGAQPRYLFPAMPVYSTFLLILIYQVFGLLKEIIFNAKKFQK